MKLNKIFAAMTAILGLSCMISCSDLSGIEDRLDKVESEIKKFDTLVEELNTNVESLYYLKDGNVITKDPVQTEKGWEIELSNGKKIEILNGISGNSPVVSIKDGYWYIDGVKQDVKAAATDGKTPQFGVDAAGYWTISFDGGTPSRVKDAEGKDVPAKVEVTGGDSYFASVEVKDNCLVLKLRDNENTEISVPIVKGFSFVVKKAGALVEGVQKIAEGTSEEFDVEQTGVASAAIVACPAGFEAELTDTKLVVTATAETKASASTAKDLAILAISEKGFSMMSKIQIEKGTPEPGEGGEEPEQPEPDQPEPEQPKNSFEKYMAGEDITIGELTINKAAYGDATLITNESESKNIATKGVYFVASDATDVTINGTASQIVVLSLDENVATIKRTENKSFYLNASAENDYLVFSNIKYETVMSSGNIFGIGGDGEVESIFFHKCKIEIPANMNMLYGSKNIHNINMTDCDVKLHKGDAVKNIIQTNTTNTYNSVVFKNNIFYCTDGNITNFGLFTNTNATISALEFRNNTIAGVYCKATTGYVAAKAITAGDVVSNLFYVPEYSTLIPDKFVGIIWVPNGYDDAHLNETIKSNLAFYDNDAVPSYRIKGTYYGSRGQIYNKAKADNPIPAPDYTNGVFTQGDNFKSFGAQR